MTPQKPAPGATPAPTPTPTGTPGPVNVGGVVLAPPPAAASGSSDLYGVGDWASQPVQPGDLGFPVDGNTGQDIAKALDSADPQTKARLQQALLWGGWYSDSSYQPMLGVFKTEDLAALAAAIKAAGQQNMPVGQLLMSSATFGVANGIAAAAQQVKAATAKAASPLPNKADLAYAADQAALSVLGRKATAAEKAAFAASYDSAVRASEGVTSRRAARAQAQLQQDAAQAQVDPSSLLPPSLPQGLIKTDRGVQDAPGGYNPDGTPGFTASVDTLGGILQNALADSNVALTDTGGSGSGASTREQPPDVNVAAENFIRNENPTEARQQDLGNTLNMFLRLISSNVAQGVG